jgi:hypothetical protein
MLANTRLNADGQHEISGPELNADPEALSGILAGITEAIC